MVNFNQTNIIEKPTVYIVLNEVLLGMDPKAIFGPMQLLGAMEEIEVCEWVRPNLVMSKYIDPSS